MSFLTSWLLSVIGTAFLVSLCEALMMEEKVREVGRLVGGLLMLLALLSPLVNARLNRAEVTLDDYFVRLEERQDAYRQIRTDTLSANIKERSETYIETAAAELGLSVHAEIRLETAADGTPVIAAAELDIPYHRELAERMERELGIGAERQSWAEQESG